MYIYIYIYVYIYIYIYIYIYNMMIYAFTMLFIIYAISSIKPFTTNSTTHLILLVYRV